MDLWLALDIMHHRWLLLLACFWVLFMLMVASKFITLTMRSPERYGMRQGSLTILPELEKMTVTEARKFQIDSQPTADTLENMTHIDLVHKQRLELLRSVCRNGSLGNLSHSAISKFVLDRIFVSDRHKILFCQTPKVGNTQWKKVLIVLNEKLPLRESRSVTRLAMEQNGIERNLDAFPCETGGI